MSFVPRDPHWSERVRASFSQQGAMRLIGARIVALEPGRCELEAAFRADLTQQHGYFHAGITSALADSAGGFAAMTLYAPGREVLTAEFKVNLLAPARGDRLVAIGNVLRSGRLLTVCTVDAFACDGAVRTHCALMQMTLAGVEMAATPQSTA